MKFSGAVRISPILAAILAWAQDQPPVVGPVAPPATVGVTPAPAGPPVLENTGKPMVLPLHCADEEMQWGGLTCSEEDPCPIYLELGAVAAQGGKIVVAGNIHSAAVTLASALLASEDDGHTWREPYERIRGAGLEHIQFLDGDTAWVSGLTLYPLVEDPFLLLSTDGGKTWHARPVASESHPGAIQQFFFGNRTNGALIVDRGRAAEGDRYERYESPNGGESWTIQEESVKPMTLKQTAAPQADWRVRADAASQSYQIEHRQGTRWTSLSAFAVKVGMCKPEQ